MIFVRPERATLWPDPQPLHSGAEVWADAFAAIPSFDLTMGAASVTVDGFEASGNAVRFWVTVRRGDDVVFEDDHVVVNPPVLDGDREPLDVLAFVCDMVEEHLP